MIHPESTFAKLPCGHIQRMVTIHQPTQKISYAEECRRRQADQDIVSATASVFCNLV